MRIALHLAKRRADDHLEAQIRRRGVARQTEHGRAVHDAEGLRFARAHVHRDHEQLTCGVDDLLDEIVVAVRRATARNHKVIVGSGCHDGRLKPFEVVSGNGQHRWNSTCINGASSQRIAVRVANLALHGHLGRLHELRARGDDGDLGTTVRLHARDTTARQEANTRRMYDLTRVHDNFARLGLFTGAANVVPRLCGLRERHAAPLAPVARDHVDDFVLDDGVGRSGKWGAGHDAHALAILDRPIVEATCGNLGDDVQLHRGFRTCRRKLGLAHRKAVHGSMGERRNVDIARQVLCRHAPDDVEHAHFFYVKR